MFSDVLLVLTLNLRSYIEFFKYILGTNILSSHVSITIVVFSIYILWCVIVSVLFSAFYFTIYSYVVWCAYISLHLQCKYVVLISTKWQFCCPLVTWIFLLTGILHFFSSRCFHCYNADALYASVLAWLWFCVVGWSFLKGIFVRAVKRLIFFNGVNRSN